jgi:hypothetical protein
MPQFKINDIKPGMTLELDVVTLDGRILLKSGHEIKPENIDTFLSWGINHVSVIDDNNSGDIPKIIEIPQNILDDVETEISKLFLHLNRKDPVVEELFRLSALYKIKSKPGMDGIDVL